MRSIDSLSDAYELGFDNGFGIAESNMSDFAAIVRQAYEKQETEKETFVSECIETESDHFRQFSPFEFYANDMNDSDDPDLFWATYDEGVFDGIYCVVYENSDVDKYKVKLAKFEEMKNVDNTG